MTTPLEIAVPLWIIAKLLDPVIAVPSLILGATICRTMWRQLIAAVVIAAISEALLIYLNELRSLLVIIVGLILGTLAALAWMTAGRTWQESRARKRRQS